MNRRRRYTGWVMVAATLCLLFAGWTTEVRADNTQVRAARLSFLQGTVNIDHIDNTGSDPAQINMPLPQGVRVSTGQDGEAEIEFEDGSVVRLTPNSSLELTALTADPNGNLTTDLTLVNGLAYAELRAAAQFAYSVNAGGVQVSPVTDATVRIGMDQPPAVISVLDGTAQVNGGSASGEGYKTNVNAGETLTGDATDPGRYQLTRQVAANSWDKWNNDRDTAAANETAEQTDVRGGYAGAAGYGWSDLDANGSWYNIPGQGEVWQPNVAMDASFDPYGYGSWVWYPGSGYVWASGYAWGWTPYRCGNWSYWDDFGWGWQPGIGCGGFGGWGFGGGGYVINIARFPRNYRIRPIPVHSPVRPRPIHVGHPIENPVHPRPISGVRTIAGRTVEPIRPVQGASAAFRGTRPIGAPLRRDFPVNGINRRQTPGNSAPAQRGTPAMGMRPGVAQPGNPVNPGTGMENRGGPVRQARPQPSIEQRQVRPQQVRPQQEMRQVAPQQQVRPVQPQQPRYTQPQQPHYAPPPHYTPPPQPHYAPPPPPPASHSAPSAPASSRK